MSRPNSARGGDIFITPTKSSGSNERVSMKVMTYRDFIEILNELLGFEVDLPKANQVAVAEILQVLEFKAVDRKIFISDFYGRINEKLTLNQKSLFSFLRAGAENGVTFNYHQKKHISWLLNRNMKTELLSFLRTLNLSPDLVKILEKYAVCISHENTQKALVSEISIPTKLRKSMDRDVYVDVASSAAACLIWSLYPSQDLMKYFDTSGEYSKSEGFLVDLEKVNPILFARERALVIAQVTKDNFVDYDSLKMRLENALRFEYMQMSNYGYFALLIEVSKSPNGREWELAGELTLFAERLKLIENGKSYFRKEDIQATTTKAIPNLDLEKAKFHLTSEGFTYKDLFVMHDQSGKVEKLLLIFQKNDRDETLIPCPACRSAHVRGNSYPTFGVKSWECQNLLCPERSIYNRGKRYSFKSLLNQAAIEEDENRIPLSSIRKWRRDVLLTSSNNEIFEMLMRHYSMKGDVVVFQDINSNSIPTLQGRVQLFESKLGELRDSEDTISTFVSRYFQLGKMNSVKKVVKKHKFEIVHGDSLDILAGIKVDTFDGAVTSPPYFNAREYSQWDNLYVYLHEMTQIHKELLRTLKPGALYYFNVFDYFDNDRTITYSAMGKKRLALSACFIDLFKRIGFEMVGNIVWDKGDVEGKRSFNAGNLSPFYQAPLNCWEHVLVFKKPGESVPVANLNYVLKIQPVIKMIKGVNTFGHTAPYPVELPLALLKDLPEFSLIVDPFGGSGTSARAALMLNQSALIIEKDATYAKLANRLCKEFETELEN